MTTTSSSTKTRATTATRTPDLARIAASVDELVRAGDTRRLRQVHRQLKSAVDRKRVAERTRRFGRDPVGWVRRRLRQFVWSKQAEVLESVRDQRRTAVRSGHGVAKSQSSWLSICRLGRTANLVMGYEAGLIPVLGIVYQFHHRELQDFLAASGMTPSRLPRLAPRSHSVEQVGGPPAPHEGPPRTVRNQPTQGYRLGEATT
ncbi:hypothetical protein GCM10009530_63530 [Microbispora corallina]|uniref:Transposase n=1 Tax=Microbispora corallina TaxID=83302 RepID=A0ABQ4GBK2_9ACTN|nr:hypothetical protein Mco01_74170 [Microbispora corallina]